jgi:hypothetical protein
MIIIQRITKFGFNFGMLGVPWVWVECIGLGFEDKTRVARFLLVQHTKTEERCTK